MSDFREEEKLGKLYDTRLTHRLMKYLRPYRLQVFFAVGMSLAVAGMEIVGPFLFGRGVDRYILPVAHGEMAKRVGLIGLAVICLLYLGSLVASFALQYLQMRIMQSVGRRRCTTCARKFSSIFSGCR